MIDLLWMIALKLFELFMSGMIFFFVGYLVWAIYHDAKWALVKYKRKRVGVNINEP